MEYIAALLPEGIAPGVALLLVVASAFTSGITAVFGLGGGLAMLALMGVFMPVAALIPVHAVVQVGSNTGRAWHLREHVRLDIARPFLIGTVGGAIVGYFVLVELPDAALKIVLGAFIMLLTWVPLPGIGRLNSLGLSIASMVIGVGSMLVGATGPLVSVILARVLSTDRKALIATHAAAMTGQHLAKVLVFLIAGFAFLPWLPLTAAMVASGFLGTVYGSVLLDRIPEATFRRWFKIGITLLAIDLLRRGLMAQFA